MAVIIQKNDPLSAAAQTLGGIAQQRTMQQELQRQAAQQQLENAFRQQQLSMEQSNADRDYKLQKGQADSSMRARGVDPDTGKPFVLPKELTQLRPNNKGKGGIPSALDEAQHLGAVAAWYDTQGAYDVANSFRAQAASKIQEYKDQQTVANQAAQLAERIRHDKSLEGAAATRAAAEIERVQVELQHNEITAAQGQQRIQIALQNAQQEHNDRIRGQDLEHQDRVRGQDQTQQRAMAAAGRLAQAQLAKQNVNPPTDDPHFFDVYNHFVTNPQDRDAMLQDPKMPASTKAYLQRIQTLLP